MVLKTFRITHSMLVEHYQYIEAHLEAIYAAVSDEPYWNALEEIEKDSLGDVRVALDALWGAQTQRAVANFRIARLPMPAPFIRALGLIIWAAAET